MNRIVWQSRLGIVRAFLQVVTGWCLFAALVSTQVSAEGFSGYVQLPIRDAYKDAGTVKKIYREISAGFRDRAQFDQQKSAIKAYYDGFLFPAMTRQEYAEQLPSLRSQFLSDIAGATSPAKEYLIEIAWNNCTLLLKGTKYHPIAQVNAALILGEINVKEGVPNDRGPIPYSKSLMPLVSIASPSKSFAEPVKAAALQGVVRHATLRSGLKKSSPGELSEAERQAIAKLALEILDAKEVPSTRTTAAHAWLQARAIQALGALQSSGPDHAYAKRMLEIVKDDNADKRLRLAAVEALGMMGLGEGDVDPKQLARSIGRLMIDMAVQEIDKLRLEQQMGGGYAAAGPQSVGRSPSGYSGEFGDAASKPKDVLALPATERPRRRMLTWLEPLQRGVAGDAAMKTTGLRSILPMADAKLFADSLVAVIKVCKDKESDFGGIGGEMEKIRDEFEKRFPLVEPESSEENLDEEAESVAEAG